MKVEVIEELQNIVGENWVIKNREDLIDYLVDETAFAVRPKAAEDIILITPITTQEVSRILELAEKWKIPVFPRGAEQVW